MASRAEPLGWDADLPLFSRVMLTQWTGAMLATLLLVALIMAPIFLVDGDLDGDVLGTRVGIGHRNGRDGQRNVFVGALGRVLNRDHRRIVPEVDPERARVRRLRFAPAAAGDLRDQRVPELEGRPIEVPFETATGAVRVALPELEGALAPWSTRSARIAALMLAASLIRA